MTETGRLKPALSDPSLHLAAGNLEEFGGLFFREPVIKGTGQGSARRSDRSVFNR